MDHALATRPPAVTAGASAETARDKAFAAERDVALVRAAIIAFNIVAWYGFLDRADGIAWLAGTIAVLAALYGAFVLVARPYEWIPALRASTVTASMDAALITLWLIATGAGASAFFPLWFVSLFAVAFRYSLGPTVSATAVYVVGDALVLAWDGTLFAQPAEAAVRAAYIVFAGALAGLLARETYRQIGARVALRRRAESAAATGAELSLLRRLTSGIGAARDVDAALGSVVAAAVEASHWSVGEAWVPDRDGRLRRAAHATFDDAGAGYIEEGATLSLARGEGLPGRAWASASIEWLHGDWEGMPRGEAARQAGLAHAVAIPLMGEGDVVAILLFAMPQARAEDERKAHLVAAAASPVGPALLRRQAEARARILAEAAFEGICLLDHGVVLEANSAMGRLLGMDVIRLEGMHVRRLVAPEDRHRIEAWLAEAAGATEHDVVEFRFARADEQVVLVEVQGRDTSLGDRGVRVMAIRDITERRRTEEADRVAMERQMEISRLEEVNRIKTHLLNTASHELNTPLTPLRLQLHLLATGRLGQLSEGQRKAVGVLERNVERLSDLVHDVLDVARLQGAGLRIDPKDVPVAPALGEVEDAFLVAAAEKGLRLTFSARPDLVVRADPDRLAQILFNLVSNALKFTDDGGVDVRAYEVEEGIEFVVRDTGRGLDRQQMQRLFQPFSQVHDGPVRGTGLGLYICKGIVEQHGGSMWVESQGVGKGSAFYFRLLRAGASAVAPEGRFPAAAPAPAREPPGVAPGHERPARPPRPAGPAASRGHPGSGGP